MAETTESIPADLPIIVEPIPIEEVLEPVIAEPIPEAAAADMSAVIAQATTSADSDLVLAVAVAELRPKRRRGARAAKGESDKDDSKRPKSNSITQHKHCKHGRQMHTCKECGGKSICQHNRQRYSCKECGGRGICEHGKLRSGCKQCGGTSVCTHGRIRSGCKQCGASSLCEHNRQRSRCKECGGSSICEHGRQGSQCKECAQVLVDSIVQKQTNPEDAKTCRGRVTRFRTKTRKYVIQYDNGYVEEVSKRELDRMLLEPPAAADATSGAAQMIEAIQIIEGADAASVQTRVILMIEGAGADADAVKSAQADAASAHPATDAVKSAQADVASAHPDADAVKSAQADAASAQCIAGVVTSRNAQCIAAGAQIAIQAAFKISDNQVANAD